MTPSLLQAPLSFAPIGNRVSRALGPYRGYARPGALERPLFSFDEAESILEEWKALAPPDPELRARYDAHYNSNHRAFWFYDPLADAWHQWDGEEAGVATLFPIGEGVWKWECRS